MWTKENRGHYDRSRLRYPSDLTDEEWALVVPLIPPPKRGGGKRTVNIREVLNGIFYVLWTGCQWKALPKDLPPKSTVHWYFMLWDWDGTLERLHQLLRRGARAGRSRGKSDGRDRRQPERQSGAKGGLRLTRRVMMRARKPRAASGISSSIRSACC